MFCFTSLCVFKCVFKVLVYGDAKSHWLHLYDFPPVCFIKCVFKVLACVDAKSHWLHLFDFSPPCVIKMFLQIAFSQGCKVTLVAFVWLFSTVRFQMFTQIAWIIWRIITLVAFVCLVSTMCFQMFLQETHARRWIGTLVALVACLVSLHSLSLSVEPVHWPRFYLKHVVQDLDPSSPYCKCRILCSFSPNWKLIEDDKLAFRTIGKVKVVEGILCSLGINDDWWWWFWVPTRYGFFVFWYLFLHTSITNLMVDVCKSTRCKTFGLWAIFCEQVSCGHFHGKTERTTCVWAEFLLHHCHTERGGVATSWQIKPPFMAFSLNRHC